MRKLVLDSMKSPIVCTLAAKLWQRNTSNALTIVDTFLRQNYEYLEEKIETLISPEYMLNGLKMSGKLRGDCDDITTLHAALLTCMNIPVEFVAIRSMFENPNFDHVYLQAQDSRGEWIAYDLTLPLKTEIQYFGKITTRI